MTIKKKYSYLFHKLTNCKAQCLEHIVVFGRLIFVVEGLWDGKVPYRTGNRKSGVAGRVVKSTIIDISGVSYTKVLYKTKTRLSRYSKKGFLNSQNNNRRLGLNLNLLTDPSKLRFIFYYRILIPNNFKIPSTVDISGTGVFPLYLNSRMYDDLYIENSFLYNTKIFDKDVKFRKILGNYSIIHLPTPTVDTSSTKSTTLYWSSSLYSEPEVVSYIFFIKDEITDFCDEYRDCNKTFYQVGTDNTLSKYKFTTSYSITNFVTRKTYRSCSDDYERSFFDLLYDIENNLFSTLGIQGFTNLKRIILFQSPSIAEGSLPPSNYNKAYNIEFITVSVGSDCDPTIFSEL